MQYVICSRLLRSNHFSFYFHILFLNLLKFLQQRAGYQLVKTYLDHLQQLLHQQLHLQNADRPRTIAAPAGSATAAAVCSERPLCCILGVCGGWGVGGFRHPNCLRALRTELLPVTAVASRCRRATPSRRAGPHRWAAPPLPPLLPVIAASRALHLLPRTPRISPLTSRDRGGGARRSNSARRGGRIRRPPSPPLSCRRLLRPPLLPRRGTGVRRASRLKGPCDA
jgi:hypothetical protein